MENISAFTQRQYRMDEIYTHPDVNTCVIILEKKRTLHKGNASIAKILQVPPSDVQLYKFTKNPHDYFQALASNHSIDKLNVYGVNPKGVEYVRRHYLKAELRQTINHRLVIKIEEKGALQCAKDGDLTVNQLSHAEGYEKRIRVEEKKGKQEAKNIVPGKKFAYISYKHFKHDPEQLKKQGVVLNIARIVTPPLENNIASDDSIMIDKDTLMTRRTKINTVKQKHYYVYSGPGYGKTDIANDILHDLNADFAKSVKNFCGLRENAQFYMIDEYGPFKRFETDDLKQLTAGNASAFGGNRKAHGDDWTPHKDAQLIIFSNYHLFYAQGKGKKRAIDAMNAKALRQRFHIIKLDAMETGVTEEEDAKKYTEDDAAANATEKKSKLRQTTKKPKKTKSAVFNKQVFIDVCKENKVESSDFIHELKRQLKYSSDSKIEYICTLVQNYLEKKK